MVAAMGNRESLITGAKHCLREQGYSRTTSRDIAREAGTSLAAIGYHFGSTEALLNEALFESVAEWGEQLDRALSASADDYATPSERFDATWAKVIESAPEQRSMWATQFEIVGLIDHVPQVKEFLVNAQRYGRGELAALFHGIDPHDDPVTARLVGGFHQALLAGVMLQWLVDPEEAPTADEIIRALRAVAALAGTAGGPSASIDT